MATNDSYLEMLKEAARIARLELDPTTHLLALDRARPGSLKNAITGMSVVGGLGSEGSCDAGHDGFRIFLL